MAKIRAVTPKAEESPVVVDEAPIMESEPTTPEEVADQLMESIFDSEPTELTTEDTPTSNFKKPRMERVCTRMNHRCCIAGVWYTFVAGEIQQVSAEVKEILMRGGYLTAL